MFVGKLLMWLLINASWNDKTDAGELIYEDVYVRIWHSRETVFVCIYICAMRKSIFMDYGGINLSWVLSGSSQSPEELYDDGICVFF